MSLVRSVSGWNGGAPSLLTRRTSGFLRWRRATGEITPVSYSMDPGWCGGQHNSKLQVGLAARMDGWSHKNSPIHVVSVVTAVDQKIPPMIVEICARALNVGVGSLEGAIGRTALYALSTIWPCGWCDPKMVSSLRNILYMQKKRIFIDQNVFWHMIAI